MSDFAATTTADGYPCHYFGTYVSTCGTTLHCVGVFTPFGLFERNYDEQGRRLSWDHGKAKYYVDETRQESVGPSTTNEGGAIMSMTWKPTTAGGHHVRNVQRYGTGWRGEVCLRTDCLPSVNPADWQIEAWYSDGTYYGGKPKSDLDLVAISPGDRAMDWKERIKQWAADRNLIEGSTPWNQVRKLIEETEELATALHENNVEETKDAIGDIQVVLAVMCAQLGLDIDECREIAWEQIKDRKGKMVDGVFVKEVQGERHT